MKKKLTSVVVDNVSAEPGERVEIRDTMLPAFGLRVSGSVKTYFCVVRPGRRQKQKRITIGRHPTLSLADARAEARKILSAAQFGTYRAEAKHASHTFSDVVEEFLAKHVRVHNRCIKEPTALLRQKFKPLHPKPIKDIRRHDVVRCLDAMATTPARSNRALAAIKTLFGWAVDRGIVDIHPLTGLKPPAKEVSRERVLTDAELARMLASLDGYPFGPMFAIMLLTGQRRGEVSSMRWSHIDGDTWTIPAANSKNKQAHAVPLTPPVLAILDALPRSGDIVFSTTGTTPVSGFSKAKARLDAAMGVSDWRGHDLRRTAASGMARLGVAPHVIEAVLNHRSGQISGIAKVYNRHQYLDEKRDALARWAEHVRGIQ